MRYRPQTKIYFAIFFIDCLILGLCGAHEPDEQLISGLTTFVLGDSDLNSFVWLSRIAAAYYFFYFLIVTPFILPFTETPLPAPESISTPVLSHPAAVPAGAAAAPEQKG
jgi:ubiquinol-cytochrome c reductase cytochrome b subunit